MRKRSSNPRCYISFALLYVISANPAVCTCDPCPNNGLAYTNREEDVEWACRPRSFPFLVPDCGTAALTVDRRFLGKLSAEFM